MMAAVRSSQNKSTELRLIALFRHHRITGWRRHYPLFGNPDFTFPKLKLALFVDGCFWHSCPLHGTLPASHRPYWRKKLRRNRARDRLVSRRLRAQGWRTARIWEHDLTPKRLPALARRLRRLLTR